MHTDSHVTYNFCGLTAAGVLTEDVQVENADAPEILALVGRSADEADDASIPFDSVPCPNGGDIAAFGVTITEALTNANATKCIVALKVLDKEAGTTTTVATLTLPAQASEVVVADSRGSDGTPTQAQAVAIGARFISSDLDVPYRIPQGGKFYVEQTQAAGAAGGAFKAWVVVRQTGLPDPGPVAKSPITKLSV